MQKKEIKIKDILKMLDDVTITYGNASLEYNDDYLKPITKLIYNHLVDKSKEELNEIKIGKNQNLYQYLLNKNQGIIFSILTEKGAFKEYYDKNVIDLIKKIKPLGLNNNFHQFVFLHESSKSMYKKENDIDFIENAVDFYLSKEEDAKKRNVVINHFLTNTKFKNIFIEVVLNSTVKYAKEIITQTRVDFLQEVIQEANKNNIDILQQEKSYLNNKYLKGMNKDGKFFISTLNENAINLFLTKGFTFDNENYEFNGKSLITNLIETDRREWINIIDGVNSINCPKELRKKQDEAVNGLNDTYFSNIKLWYLKEVKKQEIKEITEELDEKNPKGNEVIKKRKI